MVAGRPNIDYPDADTALSVVPFGQDDALTSRVRHIGAKNMHVTSPRNGVGVAVALRPGDLMELSWQADDGFRSVDAQLVDVGADGLLQLRIKGEATRTQRREAVRAPLGLPVRVVYGRTELVGSTVDLSEGGLRCVFRPHGDLGTNIPFPKAGHPIGLVLDLYSDQLDTQVEFVRRRRREDQLHEWSLKFLQLPEPAKDLIRSHVFTALRNARARGLVT
ncbi:flagellar brake protein [Modestobacter lapidis]